MTSIKVIVFFVCAVCVFHVRSERHFEPRIAGGETVTNRTDFAYQVSIRLSFNNRHMCGGSIIDPKLILTSASCLTWYQHHQLLPKDIIVVGGDLNVDISDGHTVIKTVSKILVHAKFEWTTFVNDIAIIELSSPFIIDNKTLSVIKASKTKAKPGTDCVISGWGATSRDPQATYFPSLLYTNVSVMKDSICEDIYDKTPEFKYSKGMLCAGYLSVEKNFCNGDDGGPLVTNGLQVGIISYGAGCGAIVTPGVYTDLSAHITWVKDQTGVDISNSMTFKPSLILIAICIYLLRS